MGRARTDEVNYHVSSDLGAVMAVGSERTAPEIHGSILEYVTEELFAQELFSHTPAEVKKITRSFRFSSEAETLQDLAPDVVKALRRFVNDAKDDTRELSVVKEDPQPEAHSHQATVDAQGSVVERQRESKLSPHKADTGTPPEAKGSADRNKVSQLHGLKGYIEESETAKWTSQNPVR